MLRDVIAIKAKLVGAFHQPQALLVKLGQAELVAIDPVEDAELDRPNRWGVRKLILRLSKITLNPFRVVTYENASILNWLIAHSALSV